MPIYEYQCTGKCKKKFEYMQSMSEPRKTKCEKCGGKLEKLISAAGFVLKGGGWYKDLYASQKPGASSGGSDGESTGSSSSEKGDKAAKTDGKADGKADKAEAKAESKVEKTEAKSPKSESKPERASTSSKKAKRK